ncbi:putative phosphoenolpyruvate synthase [Nymphon striatum]|nr:putative phosphoenolpyruvate synthase [Nymphon striatum]
MTEKEYIACDYSSSKLSINQAKDICRYRNAVAVVPESPEEVKKFQPLATPHNNNYYIPTSLKYENYEFVYADSTPYSGSIISQGINEVSRCTNLIVLNINGGGAEDGESAGVSETTPRPVNKGYSVWIKYLYYRIYVAIVNRPAQRFNNYDKFGENAMKSGILTTDLQRKLEIKQDLSTQEADEIHVSAFDYKNGNILNISLSRQNGMKGQMYFYFVLNHDGKLKKYKIPSNKIWFFEKPGDEDVWTAGDLRMWCLEPLKKWRFFYNGFAQWRPYSAVMDNLECATNSVLATALAKSTSDDPMPKIHSLLNQYDIWGAFFGYYSINGGEETELFLRGNKTHRVGEWDHWKRRFLTYRKAVKLHKEENDVQVCSLLYAMGSAAQDIVASFNLSEEDQNNFEIVIQKLENYFIPKRNIIFERAKFNGRSQAQGENVEPFVRALYNLAEFCEFGDQKEEHIRDRLVIGIVDQHVSEKLQLLPDLTLSKAIEIARNSELVKSQNFNKTENVEQVKKNNKEPDNRPCNRYTNSFNNFKDNKVKIQSEVNNENADKVKFLGEIKENGSAWYKALKVNDVPINFKLDTGADVTIVPPIYCKCKLIKTDQKLSGPGKSPLNVLGKFLGKITSEKYVIEENIYVIDQCQPLLSRNACVKLNLVKLNVDKISAGEEKFVDEFPQLFSGIGCVKNFNYDIKLRNESKPFCTYSPRKVPYALQDKVKKELDRMEKIGVIYSVNEPTDWCSPMVVVPKGPNAESVRICIDYTELNKFVQREIHPVSIVQDSLAKLGKGIVFSKIDTNSGFWQIPLSEKSKQLTCFLSPFGRYAFNRLPFGKENMFADALSRSGPGLTHEELSFEVEVLEYATHSIDFDSKATPKRLVELKNKQRQDEVCSKVIQYVEKGWPKYTSTNDTILRPYSENRGHLTLVDGILVYNDRIVIPMSERLDILRRIHRGHLGITKCRALARQYVWWPGMSQAIAETVNNCHECLKQRNDQKEPLLPREFPQRPWEHVGSDLFYLKGKWYVLVIDYYSRYVEVGLLENLHSHGVINQLKSIFARHGVPELMTSDNGPQYASKEFEEFCGNYGFQHSTSSPKYPQSNGEAERAVQTVKNIFKKESDPYLALLAYRSSPLANGKSPAELLFNRKLRTSIPCITKVLDKIIDTSDISAKENARRNEVKSHYDNRFRVHEQPDLTPGESVWVKDLKRSGVVSSPWKGSPRSFNVKSDGETVRRNRRSLITLPLSDGNEISPNIATPEDDSKDISIRTSSYGRPLRPTKIFDFIFHYRKYNSFLSKECSVRCLLLNKITGRVNKSNPVIYIWIETIERISEGLGVNWGTNGDINMKISKLSGSLIRVDQHLVHKGIGSIHFGYENDVLDPVQTDSLTSESIFSPEKVTSEETKRKNVLLFTDSACTNSALTGGKGSSLAILSSISEELFVVPQGFCITISAYDDHLQNNPNIVSVIKDVTDFMTFSEVKLKAIFSNCQRKLEEEFIKSKVSSNLKNKIEESLNSICGDEPDSKRFAVRSSALGEDGEELSCAGQMETFLGCKGINQIFETVKKCWASLFGFKAIEYRRQNGQVINIGMCVVVQEMVAAEAAGVMFTRDPRTGSPQTMSIASNHGLGESVVSAAADPDDITVGRAHDGALTCEKYCYGQKSNESSDESSISCIHRLKICGGSVYLKPVNIISESEGIETVANELADKQCSITNEQILILAQIGVYVEKKYGDARDIEWAMSNGKPYLLQSRPITSLYQMTDSEYINEYNTPLFSDNDMISSGNVKEVLPGALSPLWNTYFDECFVVGLDMGYQINDKYRTVEAENISNGFDIALNGRVIDDVGAEEFGIQRHGYIDEQKYLIDVCSQERNTDPYLPRDRLHTSRILHRGRVLSSIFRSKSFKILQNITNNEKWIKNKNNNKAHTDRVEWWNFIRIPIGYNWKFNKYSFKNCILFSVMSSELANEFDKVNPRHWPSITTIYISDEKYEDFANLMAVDSCTEMVESANVPKLANAIRQATGKEKFTSMSKEVCSWSTEAVKWLTSNNSPVKNDYDEFIFRHGHRCIKEFDPISKPWCMDPSKLIAPLCATLNNDNVKYKKKLTIDEALKNLKTPLTSKQKKKLRDTVLKARQFVAYREQAKSLLIRTCHEMRKGFIRLGELMVLDGRLPDAELVMFMSHSEIKTLTYNRSAAIIQNGVDSTLINFTLPGGVESTPVVELIQLLENNSTPVSRGIVEATARVVQDVEDAGCIKNGDILVTTSTDIAWSPYFSILSGVITEIGGLVSHGAVVAREYGIPCVVGVTGATDSLKSGDMIRLNGNTGAIERLDS